MRRWSGLLALTFVLLTLTAPGPASWLPSWLRDLFGIQPLVITTRYATNNGNTSGTCTASTAGTNGPCRLDFVLPLQAAGDTLILKNGTYQGANNMLSLSGFAAGISGSSGAPITVQAETEGSVFIDGQGARTPFISANQSYWTIQGIDFGNSNNIVMYVNASGSATNLIFQRVVASNAAEGNNHVWSFGDCQSCLFEDIAGFGVGRNVFVEGANHNNSILRRAWLRWDGSNDVVGTPLQACYACTGAMIYENVITVWNPVIPPFSSDTDKAPGFTQRDGTTSGQDRFRGVIAYGMATLSETTARSWIMFAQSNSSNVSMVDVFTDGRSQNTAYGNIFISATLDRFTSILTSGQPAANTGGSVVSNFNECATLGACPNFYSGGTSPVGARNCFEYTGAVLGSNTATQALWPWRMDDRIKAAIARAGGTALTGAAGPGYAAGTVTSEIVARYGAAPAACTRTGSFTPSFPLAGDFPSTGFLDQFNRGNASSLGSNWTIVSGTGARLDNNQAAPPLDGSFTRMAWSASTFIGAGHEVHGDWPIGIACCGQANLLVFAAQDLTSNNQYRLNLSRSSGANATLDITKVDGSGASTSVLGPIDLGTDVGDGHGFGVRVDTLKTITAYWKYTDGLWYKLGSVVDGSVPSGAVRGGFALFDLRRLDNFGGGTCCGAGSPPSSGNVGRFGSIFPKSP